MMFMDYIGVFELDFSKKGTKSSKIWASYQGPKLRRRDPRRGEGPRQGVACHVAAWPNGRLVKPRVRGAMP